MNQAPRVIRTGVIDDETLARRLLCSLLAGDARFDIVGQAGNGAAALRLIRRARPDVIFLDIEMPDQSGIELAQCLREQNSPAIVFVTAYDRYAVDAFGVAALDYLLKPIDKPRFALCLDRIASHFRDRNIARLSHEIAALAATDTVPAAKMEVEIRIRHQGGLARLPVADILWLEGANQYTTVHTALGSYLVSESLKSFEARLSPAQFLRVHRSAIVNTAQIASIKGAANGTYRIRLSDGASLTLARSKRGLLAELLPRVQ